MMAWKCGCQAVRFLPDRQLVNGKGQGRSDIIQDLFLSYYTVRYVQYSTVSVIDKEEMRVLLYSTVLYIHIDSA